MITFTQYHLVPIPAFRKTVETDLEDVVEVMDKMLPLKQGKCEGRGGTHKYFTR